MKKFKKLFILISLMCIMLLTGCTNQEYGLQLNDDDSVVFTCQVTVNNDIYMLLGTYGIDTAALNRQKNMNYEKDELNDVDALFQEFAVMYDSYGFTIAPINDTIDVGFKATKKYATIDEINKEIKELNKAGLCGFDFEIMQSKNTFDTEYKVYGNLNYILDPDIDMENDLINENFHALFDTSILKATCKITMPGYTTVTATDGTAEKGEYVWTATYDEGSTKEVHIISAYKNTSMHMIRIVVIVIVLIIAGLFISRAVRKVKSRKNNEFYENNDNYYEIDEIEADD